MADRFVQAPSHGGVFRSGEPTIVVIHSLEAPARRGLAYELSIGWIQNAGVSPHSITDPGETVDLLNLSTIGWQCGNGNQVSIGLEVTGYAAWDFATWTTGDAFAAVRLDAKRAADVATALGIPLRWLSLAQIRNGESGFCTHADISATLGGTNHTDPGAGFPYAIFMQMVQQWAGTGSTGSPNPNPQSGESGGAQTRDWWDEMSDSEKAQLLADVAELKAKGDLVWFAHAGATYEADLRGGKYRCLTAEEFTDRKYVLEQSGLRVLSWPGEVANPGAFGNLA